ncbi:hypothetical protein Cme02nite_55730 [Catellatospora methionotrophica]|uniref:VWFA domain-containing protein n=1 Tax=Catellatospora methionotrophica TaxID=121620 RepID=A0A8J3LL88_9ACTN|nr:VWA domain-containing protein [Catellatospora methionotrophica]GIG17241.1 hypothetical protein Cme02nite_55730 [Catellatospora methionotrophica]
MPLRDFVAATPRQLPVLILADVSGSMFHESKIETLNRSVGEMIRSFKSFGEATYEITVGVITFGGLTGLHVPLTPARELAWQDMSASGVTPLDKALLLAHDVLEDRSQVPSRSARPVLVLLSDGQPTDSQGHPSDNWREPLDRLLQAPRAGKAARYAVAVGREVDAEAMAVLERFAGDGNEGVFQATEVHRIVEFFEWLTMSVSQQATTGIVDGRPPLPLAERTADIVID